MLPLYAAAVERGLCASLEPLRRLLDMVWEMANGHASIALDGLRARGEACVPDEEVSATLLGALAQDAALAVMTAASSPASGDVWRCAQYATDAIDLYVLETQGLDPGDPGLEQAVLEHPLMQRELARQDRDLALLEERGDVDFDAMRRAEVREPLLEPSALACIPARA